MTQQTNNDNAARDAGKPRAAKALLKATIRSGNPYDNGRRITIRCFHDTDGKFRWFSDEGDTEVSGKNISEAKIAALNSWSGSAWDLRATWL